MGILNVIKLANDYNKAKKLLKDEKIKGKAEEVRKIVQKLRDFVAELNEYRDKLTVFILKVKETMSSLNDRIKTRKVGK